MIVASNYNLSQQYKMSAFGTKKPGGDVAVQLTFPSVYSSVYANGADRLAYYPSASEGVEHLPAGKDLQSLYHEQKRLDANRMAMAGVRSQRVSDVYARAGNAGYGVMPKAMLGQRKFANPSNGNQSDIYAARYDQMRGAGEMTGGVLRTMKGQEYGRSKLRGRIDQLNAIAEAKQGFLAGMPVDESITPQLVEQGFPEPEGIKAKTELFGAINQFRSAVLDDKLDRIAISDFYKSIKLLFRMATVADKEELGDLLEAFDEVQDVLSRNPDFTMLNEQSGSFGVFIRLVGKIREYLAKMMAGIEDKTMSLKDRKTLSASLIRSLGLTKLPSGFTGADVERRSRGDGDEFSTGMPPGEPPYQFMPRFDPSPRDRFGSRQGSWFGEDADEDEGEVGVRGITAPLNEFRSMESAQMTERPAEAPTPQFSALPEGAEEKAEEAEEEVDESTLPTIVIRRKKLSDLVAERKAREAQSAPASPAPDIRSMFPTPAPAPKPAVLPSAYAPLPAGEVATRKQRAYETYRADPDRGTLPPAKHKEIIDLALEHRNWTQRDVADVAKVHHSTVSRVLKSAGV
jgi:hypothetical protein